MDAARLPAGREDSVEAWSGKDRNAENFPVGSWLIRADLRPHVHAFYAFARNADDIADSPVLPSAEKLRRLAVMQDVLLARRDSGAPSAFALRDSLARTGVSADHSLDLLRAFRQDSAPASYPDWEALLQYCRYSAMPVGRHVLALHGEPPTTLSASDSLCAALQVLNHLQDCAKDFRLLDRCYLPMDRMATEGAGLDDLRQRAETPALRRVFDTLLDRCDELTAQAAELPRRVRDRRLRLETGVIIGLARRLAARLRRGDPIATRVKLTSADVAVSLLGAARYLA